MPNTPNGDFPFNKNKFRVDLYETGNAPDYSTVYAPGVKAARGKTEGYVIDNCPKGDPLVEIEITGNTGSDIMKYNYIGIDFYNTANQGDGMKWYFVKSKTMLNYPQPISEGGLDQFAILFRLELDYWETYKDKLNSPKIMLEQVTTSDPGSWNDISMLEQDILPFSGNKITSTPTHYTRWKTIVGWQSRTPTTQDNYIIDGMRTTLQWNSTGDTSDYLQGLDEIAAGSPEEVNIWRSYITCNTYLVSEYFSTENGGTSESEFITMSNPPSTQVHNRLNYFPYKRAFVQTIDGQSVEYDYKKCAFNKLPEVLAMNVRHATTPQPTSTIYIAYPYLSHEDLILFSAYPTMDFVGRNITPTTNLVDYFTKGGFGGYQNAGTQFNADVDKFLQNLGF